MKLEFQIILFILLTYCSFGAGGEIKGTVKVNGDALSDAVVYIEKIEGKTFSSPSQPAIMDQKDLTFVPHVLPVLVGTTVNFPNSDITRHSVFSPSQTKKFDFGTYSQGSIKSIVFDRPGPVSLLCHVHPEMSAFIVVVETPYFAVTNEYGNYKISNVPAGKYRLTVWHEWAKPKTQQVNVNEKQDATVNFSLEE